MILLNNVKSARSDAHIENPTSKNSVILIDVVTKIVSDNNLGSIITKISASVCVVGAAIEVDPANGLKNLYSRETVNRGAVSIICWIISVTSILSGTATEGSKIETEITVMRWTLLASRLSVITDIYIALQLSFKNLSKTYTIYDKDHH